MTKTRTREDIRNEYKETKAQIELLQNKLIDLSREYDLFSDDEQWYKEEVETWTRLVKVEGKRNRVKESYQVLVGRKHWNEFFQDESKPKGEGVTIERSRVIKIDGEWE